MVNKPVNVVGSTRLRRVQFGVPPNCIGARTTCVKQTANGDVRREKVSGATPETTRETRVPPYFSPHFHTSTIK
jgi:hypothetical protein